MYRPLTIVALAASGLFAFATTATAETITVCANGCDYTSINDAIDASSNGDVIQLAAETYFEGDEIDTDGIATCRTKADAPEIDGNLFIDEGAEALKPGDIVRVAVEEAGEYDLWGRTTN